ncbi:MAG: hypothetical protein HZB10_03505 [Candidatus Yonathbacteria bacterium]|nr:hypothetical protein [Candidatus Yonathbacteria bacterium]
MKFVKKVGICFGVAIDKIRESLNQKQVDFLEDIEHAFKKSGLDRLTDGVSCKHCFVRSVAQGGDIDLAQQLLIGLGGSGSIEKGDWSLGSNWGEKR